MYATTDRRVGRISGCKHSGRGAMDGQADRLLRGLHGGEPQPAHRRQSRGHYTVWRARAGVWLGSRVAPARTSSNFVRRSPEVCCVVRCRAALEHHVDPFANRPQWHQSRIWRQLAGSSGPNLQTDETHTDIGLRLCRQDSLSQRGKRTGHGTCGPLLHFSGEQRRRRCPR